MNHKKTSPWLIAGAGLACLAAGCAAPPADPAGGPTPAATASAEATSAGALYRCDQGIAFTVRFVDDTAVLDGGPRGNEVLLRDAGGTTPQQSVYSNPRLRAEFGLGANGRDALLKYLAPPLTAHCLRD